MIRDSNKFPSQDSDVSQDSKIGADIAQFSAGWTTWNRAGLQESCCKRCKFVRYARSRVRPIADRQISFREQREDIDASLIYPRYSYFSLSLSLSLSCFFLHFCLVFIYLSGYQVSTIFMGNRCFVI